tara:strand:- start:955 stop:1275 length:321 start_codon:yes stop_codon:yes gene_type:complete
MYAKVYQYKFPSITEAKIAASFCADNLSKYIIEYNFKSLNIMIGQCGSLSIIIKFDKSENLRDYERNSKTFINELKKGFTFKEDQYAGVYVYNYEAEATSSELKLT